MYKIFRDHRKREHGLDRIQELKQDIFQINCHENHKSHLNHLQVKRSESIANLQQNKTCHKTEPKPAETYITEQK